MQTSGLAGREGEAEAEREIGGESGAGGEAGPGHAGAELWMGGKKLGGDGPQTILCELVQLREMARGILIIFAGWTHMSWHLTM